MQRIVLSRWVLPGALVASFAAGCADEGAGEAPAWAAPERVAPGAGEAQPDVEAPAGGFDPRLSSMGQAAQRLQRVVTNPLWRLSNRTSDPDLPEFTGGGQNETSIAVDETGQHIVVGFNDARGFSLNPVSVSGFMYSEDGGKTFVDGGQLPSPGGDAIGAQRYPQIFGDPDVKYLGGCTFVYFSILVRTFGEGQTVQTMGFHRSSDCGKTWSGPFEVPSATNPNGQVDAAGAPRDMADKELVSVDAETGRVMMSWANFTPLAPGGVEIATTWTDDILAAQPRWSPRAVVAARREDGQAPLPRFARGGDSAYVVWRANGARNQQKISFAASRDGGATWSAPLDLAPPFFAPDQVLGNDRVNTSPAMDVDRSGGARDGWIYVAYLNNDGRDGGDIVFQRSSDGGATFSAPLNLSARPAGDRAQWFPWVSVDDDTGRLYVFFYDQGVARAGDLTQTTFLWSDDGGSTWSQPRPLTARPFRAGFGNDTGQPNLGDYNQAVAQGGELFAAWVETRPVGFADGQPTSSRFSVPSPVARRVAATEQRAIVPVQLDGVTAGDSGGDGWIDPGELVMLRPRLWNYVTSELSAQDEDVAIALVRTTTPRVQPLVPVAFYAGLPAGASVAPLAPAYLRLEPGFVPGTPIDVELTVYGLGGAATTLHARLQTGRPTETVLLREDFEAVSPGALPAGWLAISAQRSPGAPPAPWTTSATFCGGSNAAFHVNANDGAPRSDGTSASATRLERLFSPSVTIPASAEHVILEFDVCTNTEDSADYPILAFDGLLLRFADLTPGNILRAVAIEAFAEEFTTGGVPFYPKHLPRNSDPAYLQNLSVWAGDSGGPRRVRLRLPGMAGRTVQLRWEYTQDSGRTCNLLRPGVPCGVSVDNIVLKSVVSRPPIGPLPDPTDPQTREP